VAIVRLSPRLAASTPFAATERIDRFRWSARPGTCAIPSTCSISASSSCSGRRRGRVRECSDKGDRTAPGLCPPDLPGSVEWSILDAETSPGERGRSDQI